MDQSACEHANVLRYTPPQVHNEHEFFYCVDCGAIRLDAWNEWAAPGEQSVDDLAVAWDDFWTNNNLRDLCHKLILEARKTRKGYGEMALLIRDVKDVPPIVCLCGSTRFYEQYRRANYELTMTGNIVLSVGFFHHLKDGEHNEGVGCTPEEKVKLDELHKRKIDLADWVYVINVDGYIGDSTRSEIEYATMLRKPIKYLEPPGGGK